MLTPSDVQSQLNNKVVFTVIDMADRYWYVKLTEKSSYLCTLNTPRKDEILPHAF